VTLGDALCLLRAGLRDGVTGEAAMAISLLTVSLHGAGAGGGAGGATRRQHTGHSRCLVPLGGPHRARGLNSPAAPVCAKQCALTHGPQIHGLF